MEDFAKIFLQALPPHGYCLLWWPQLVWTHVVADALIALAYFSIPLALVHFVRRRRDIQFSGIFWLFAAFITLCGATHVMSIWTLWYGNYGVEALVKVATAIASVFTAVMLWPLIPRALALPSAASLRLANEELAARIAERDEALAALRFEVTERQKAEAALVRAQKIEAVGQLTGGIAHDFNNLLQAISGNIDLIGRRIADDPQLTRWVTGASVALDRGRKLTGQLLAFSRTQKLELRPVVLRDAIAEVVEMLGRTIGPQIRIEQDLGLDDWHVLADPTQLELALLNLGINARDAMPQGGTLRISARRAAVTEGTDIRWGRYIDIVVNDTGVGMTPEVRDRAFEPFFTTKDVGKGTGLGLSMVFGVIRQSGGTVLIDSEPGHGTTVTLRLRSAEPADLPTSISTNEANSDKLDGLHVMLVDDDFAVRSAIADMMREMGARVTEADGGAQALALLGDERPDLLLLDFAMPEMNGAEVAAHVARAWPDLPVIFASGYADTSAIETAIGGPIAMLRKPFTRTELAAAVLAGIKS